MEKGSERITAIDHFLQQHGDNQSFRILLADLEKEEEVKSKLETKYSAYVLSFSCSSWSQLQLE